MDKKYISLKELSQKSFGEKNIRSSAELISSDNRKYYGVNINIESAHIIVSSISNAICNAVSDGCLSFTSLTVFTEHVNHSDFVIDSETSALLKEFNIKSFKLYNKVGILEKILIA